MKLRDPRQGSNIFGIGGDCLPDYFHFSIMALHFGIMALEGLIMILLTCGEFAVALGHLLLELSLAHSQFFQYAFNPIQAIIAVRHVQISASRISPRRFALF
jgi:hypothetical protein